MNREKHIYYRFLLRQNLVNCFYKENESYANEIAEFNFAVKILK